MAQGTRSPEGPPKAVMPERGPQWHPRYHIQTSGRSLHAQEIDFNDIRTTLQALYAIYDNCNSLHTNAYDEAITTPTEESVRTTSGGQARLPAGGRPWPQGTTPNPERMPRAMIVRPGKARGREATLR